MIFSGIPAHGGHSIQHQKVTNAGRGMPLCICERNSIIFGIGIGMSDMVIAVGSTPTCSILPHLNDVDAIHPGNYLYYDMMQADLGSCKDILQCAC